MLPLKHKTIWKKSIDDAEKNSLTARIEKEHVISQDSPPTPPKITRTIEICSPAEDRRGQTIKKRMRITVDSGVLQEIKEASHTFAQVQGGSRRRQDSTVEIRCELSGRLVITRVSPPFRDRSEVRIQYVIGNGGDVRFVFDDFDDLEKIRWDLENVIV